MITTQLVALDIIRGAGGTPIPPVPPRDTHDGVGWVEPSLKKKHIDPFDRRGVIKAINRAAGLIIDEEPQNARQVTEIAAKIRAEAKQPEIDPASLAASIEKLAALSSGIRDIYADLYRIMEKLYDDQDEEDAIIALLM